MIHHFPHTSPSLFFPSMSTQSPLTGYEPNALIEVSSEATPTVLPSRRCSLESNADELAVTLDASEARERSDTGRLTSPLFSQEREVSANPFSATFSHSHSSIGKPRRDVNQCSSFEKSLTRSKRTSSRDSGSVQGFQMEREKDSVRTQRYS